MQETFLEKICRKKTLKNKGLQNLTFTATCEWNEESLTKLAVNGYKVNKSSQPLFLAFKNYFFLEIRVTLIHENTSESLQLIPDDFLRSTVAYISFHSFTEISECRIWWEIQLTNKTHNILYYKKEGRWMTTKHKNTPLKIHLYLQIFRYSVDFLK